ncbi:TPA: tetratricopeptide repeat protein, partial [Elizabethkingia anophelis]
MKIKRSILLIYLLLFLFSSCSKFSTEDYYKTFDLPLITKSDQLRYSGEFEEYVALQQKYYTIADDKGYEDGKTICYINLSKLNVVLGKFEKATEFLTMAERILDKSDNNEHKVLLYQAYVFKNNNLKLWSASLYYSDKALTTLKKIKNEDFKKKLTSPIYQLRGYNFYSQNKSDSAYVYFRKALKAEPNAITECMLATAFAQDKKPDSAAVHIQRAKEIITKKKDISSTHLCVEYATLGNYYFLLKQYDKAEIAFNSALIYEKKLRGSLIPVLLYNGLSTFYKTKGDTEKAKYYGTLLEKEMRKYLEEVDKAINPAVNKFIADVNENELRHKNRMQITIGALITLCLLIGFYTFKQIRNIRRNREKLSEKADQLKNQIGDKKYEEIVALAKKNDPKFLGTVKEAYPDFVNRLLSINPNLEESE